MLLAELAKVSGTSAASIKYYRREGLLPAGQHVTATRQEYGQRHVERLQLIQVLREMVGAPIARIGRLTAILDDPDAGLLRALQEAQAITLGVEEQCDPQKRSGESSSGRVEHRSIAPLLQHLGWPDIDSAPRRALDELLNTLDEQGAPTAPDVLLTYAEPMEQIARADLAWMRRLPDPPTTPVHTDRTGPDQTGPDHTGPDQTGPDQTGPGPSDDVLVLRAVAGTVAYDRLVQLLRALGHTSLSVMEDRRPHP